MYLILTASKDTYITNKIVENRLRATDANVGMASTLDLFKLYDESTISGSSNPKELSRLLVKFNLGEITTASGSTVDINNSSFTAKLKLSNIGSGQISPVNFNAIVFPLSRSFDEGSGTDIGAFGHLGACNFVTSSYTGTTANLWHLSGANSQGLLGSADIDIISSGNLQNGEGVIDLWKTQSFPKGTEDLFVDVTNIVSATIAGILPDEGFRISFSGSEETDNVSRFVKRFGSRHSRNFHFIPKLIVSWDDTIHDHHGSFFFDTTGSLFLKNYSRNVPSSILSGAAATPITGSDCLLLKIQTGSFVKYVTASQHAMSSLYFSGIYSASFAISQFDTSTVVGSTTLNQHINKSGSMVFNEYWMSLDQSIGYHTGSFRVSKNTSSAFVNQSQDLRVILRDVKSEYREGELARFRIFVRNTTLFC